MPSAAPAGVGSKLRSARIERALSIEETAWRTRIRPDLIRALEEDEFETIGHEGHVRSHLASYARFLGIDASEVVDEFTSALDEPAPSAIEELDRVRRTSRKPPRPKWLAAALLSGAVLIGASSVGMLGGKTERPSVVEAAPRLAPPAVTHDTSRSSDRGTVPATLAKVTVRMQAVGDTVVNVKVDGLEVFDGELAVGKARLFRARRSIEVLVADAGEVLLSVNGDDAEPAGDAGSVLHARYGPRGLIR